MHCKSRCDYGRAQGLLSDDMATLRIAQMSGGAPRKINILCDTELVCGFSHESEPDSINIIEEVLRDKGRYGAFGMTCRFLRTF